MTATPTHHGISELIASMTWEEKLAQLQIAYRPGLDDAKDLVRTGIGAVFWPRSSRATNELQRVAVEESRLGIPLLIGLDVIHGQRTIFPIPLAEAASFDPTVAATDARVSAQEATSGGVTWTFSPMIDVSRDPRWGRVAEGFGEDPYLTGVMGAAKVGGYQGSSLRERHTMLACAKHFVAYGQPDGGRDYNTVDLSIQRLRNTYLEPFRVLTRAGVATVMAAFNTVSGRPAHANTDLLTGILKDEWEFDGVVVGDADGVVNLIDHGVAEDLHDALVQSFSAGLDLEMGGNVVDATGRSSLMSTDLSESRVEDAVRRILELKYALGLFENPYVDEVDEITTSSASARNSAREASERCIVLLKNDGTLPLDLPSRRVLVVGPYAESTDHLGAWVQSFAEPAGTLLAALRQECPDGSFTVLQGATFFGQDDSLQAEVQATAEDYDVILVAVGEPSALTGEASSRSDLRLPGDQEALIAAVAATGKPFVVLLCNGRPLVTSAWIDSAPTVLEAWHLGTEGPAAIARVLSGAVSPAGRLPMSFPRSSSQVPVHYDHENTGRPARTGGRLDMEEPDIGLLGPHNTNDRFTSKYLDLDLGPQFSFGHGLSYTTFRYDNLLLSVESLGEDALRRGTTVEVSIDVTNTGSRDGDEVTQVFIHDRVASLARPVRRLRSFTRTHLRSGETTTLRFAVGWDDVGFWTNDARYVVEPGLFDVHVGGDLASTQQASFLVTTSGDA